MNSLYFLFIIIFALIFSNVKSTHFAECDIIYHAPMPDAVEIENCEKIACTFKVNSTQQITVKFTSPGDYEHIAAQATAMVQGDYLMSYGVGQPDACEGLTNTKCPLKKGDSVEYSVDMNFRLPTIPRYSFMLEFALVDPDNDNTTIECFKFYVVLEG